MDDNLILGQLTLLIYDGNNLKDKLLYYNAIASRENNKKYFQEAKKYKGSAINLLKVRFGKDSDYFQDFMDNINYQSSLYAEFCRDNIEKANGVLEYVHNALQNGLTEDLFYKREILILSDYLNQAYEFLDNGIKLAAGIYGRIALETAIKEFAKKNNITETKFEDIIIKLRKNGLIQLPFEHSLRSNYLIGSWAAHGNPNFEKLSKTEIKEFLTFIRDRVFTLQ